MLSSKMRIAYLLASLVFATQYLWLLDHGFDAVWPLRLLAGPLIGGLAGYIAGYLAERWFGSSIPAFFTRLDAWVARPGAAAALIILATLLVFLFTAGGRIYSSDDDFRLRGTKAIVENGNVVLYMHNDGYPVHCKYGITHLILAVPFYLAGQGLSEILPAGFDWATIITTSMMQFVSAVSCAIIFLICLQLGYPRPVGVFTALIIAFATITWPYSKHYFTEPLTGMFMLASFWQLLRFRYRGSNTSLMYSGLCLGLAGLNSPQVFILAAPVMGIYVLYLVYPRQEGHCQTWAQAAKVLTYYCIPLGLCLLAQLAYNYHRYGSISGSGYENDGGYPSLIYDGSPGWSIPWWVGLHGYFFSSGKSMFLYSPVLILCAISINRFYKRNRHEALLLIALAVLWFAFYAKWWAWHGDVAWGPRYTVPLTLLWFTPLAEALSWWPRRGLGFKLCVTGLVFLGVLVQMGGIGVPFGDYIAQKVNLDTYEEQYLLHYVPHFSPVLGHWNIMLKGVHLDILWLGKPFGSILMLTAVLLLNILLGAAAGGCKKAAK